MSPQEIFVWIVQSSVLLLVAAIMTALLRRAPAARLVVCRAALVGTLALFLAAPWLHTRPKPFVSLDLIPARMEASVSAPTSVHTELPKKSIQPLSLGTRVIDAPTAPPITIPQLVAGTWLSVSSALVLFLGYGYLRLNRIRRRTKVVVSGAAYDALSRSCGALAVTCPVLRVGEAVTTPFVAGVFRPTLYLPTDWAETQEPDVLEAVFRHEVAHIAGKDLSWGLAIRLISIVLWPQMLIWLLKGPANSASEELCDARAIGHGFPPEKYAASLMTLKEGLQASRNSVPIGIGAVALRSGFGKRIESIMNYKEGFRRDLTRPALAGWLASVAAAAVLAATLFAAPKFKGSTGFAYSQRGVPMSGRVTVRIVRPDGSPAKGWAGVVFDGKTRESELVEAKIESGSVTVDLSLHAGYPRATLVALEPGFGLTFKRIWPVEKPVEAMHLLPGTSLMGRALSPNGSPAANIRVVTALLTFPGNGASRGEFLVVPKDLGAVLSGRTQADGAFQIPNLPQGANVEFEFNDIKFARYNNYKNKVTLADSPLSKCGNIHLQVGEFITGRVTREGKPVVGLHIGAQENFVGGPQDVDLWGEAVTDAQGNYRMAKLLPGHYNVIADLQDTLDSEVTAVAHENVVVAEGKNISGLDFDLIPGGIVKGRVTAPDGSPLSGVEVGIYGPAHPHSSAWVQSATTAKDGTYRLRVPAGKQFVYVMEQKYSQSGQDVSVKKGEETSVDFHLD